MRDQSGQQGVAVEPDRGRQADSPVDMPAQGWKEIFVRTWKEAAKDNVALVAAGVAFYGFLALVPLLAATVLAYGLIASPEAVFRSLTTLAGALPKNIAQLIGDVLTNVIRSSGGQKGVGILLALVVALWGARNAAGSVIIALNIAYEEEEKRSFIVRTALALSMTIGAVVLALAGVAVLSVLSLLGHLFPGTSATFRFVGRLVTYPVLALGAAGAAATIYRYGPSRARAKWTWLTTGSVFSAVGWVILTLGFGFYVKRFANYDATYGSLGSVVGLLTWMYLSSYVFLFGAELNSEVEHQTAKDTTTGGAKPVGTRGAWSADHVADGARDAGAKKVGQSPTKQFESDRRDAAEHCGSSPANDPFRGEDTIASHSSDHPYLSSRITNRTGRKFGLMKVGILSSVLSTAGLALLQKRGRARAGVALLAAAAGLSLLRREPIEKV